MPLLLLAILVIGLLAAVSQSRQRQDIRSRAQIAMDPATSGDCFILPSTSNPNTLDSTRIDTAVQMAFCDTFDKPKYNLGDISVFDPNTTIPRSGALDDRRWSFARAAQNENPGSGNFDPMKATTAQFCLDTKTGVLPNKDSFFCGHQFNESEHWMEAFDDQTGYQWNSAMMRQPFDFTNRTGRIVFDVDAFTIGGHSTWTELWITDEPIPAPHLQVPGSEPSPKNAFALRLEGYVGLCPTDGEHMTVGDMAIIRDYKFGTEADLVPFNRDPNNCITTQDDHFNHFEVRLSKNRMEVWASDRSEDHGMTYPNFRRLAWADNLNLPFTRGYVHLEHVMYNNEDKGTGTPSHTYHWDNIGFDGPAQPTVRGYYFPDGWQAPGVKNRTDFLNMGYGFTDDGSQLVACTFISGNCDKVVVPPLPVNNVNLTGATSALLTLSAVGSATPQIQYRLNGTTWHTFSNPFPDQWGLSSQRGVAMPVPLSEVRQGTNTLELKAFKDTAVANVELHVFPGDLLPARVSPRGPLPTPTPCSGFCTTPTPTPTMPSMTTTPTPTATPRPTSTPTQGPTPTPPVGSLTVTFDDATGVNIPLTGQYPFGVLDWGSSGWLVSEPFAGFATKSVSFNGAGITQGTVSLLQSRRLVSLDATNGGAATTVTITCQGNPSKSQALAAGQTMTIPTGFTTNCLTVTLSSSNGWDTNFDNLVFSAVSGGSTPTPQPSPTQAGGSTIQIMAAGTKGNGIYPRMSLLLNGVRVKTWTNVRGNPTTNTFQTFTYTSASKVTNSQVRVRFDNDFYGGGGNDRNLMVDRVVIDGVSFPSDAPSVFSTGTWDSTTGCAPGNKQSKWLHCNGWFQY